MIDFSGCKILNKAYGGANGNKICIVYKDEKYMLKFPANTTKKTELSYANSCISEYISCHVFDMLDIPVQETLLGSFTRNSIQKIVVACKDFTKPGIVLQDFGSIKNQIIDSVQQGYGTELDDVLETISSQMFMDTLELKRFFWDVFIVDALLGNFDRHNGNWGFLYDQETDEMKLAPVYDCGSCLFPQADKSTIYRILNDKNELNTRVYNIPRSALQIKGKKISYYDFLVNTSDSDCKDALRRIYEKIDLNVINEFINSVECIDELQKEFYRVLISARYEKIIKAAHKSILMDVLIK